MVLAGGMCMVAGKTGDCVFSDVQIMEVDVSVSEAGRQYGLFVHLSPFVALEAELRQWDLQQTAMGRSVRCMAAKAVVIHDRRMYTLLTGLVGVALVTEPGRPVLCLAQAVVFLVIAVGELVTRGAAVPLQRTVANRAVHFARVTQSAGLAAEQIYRPL
jgi:hypothetical protein